MVNLVVKRKLTTADAFNQMGFPHGAFPVQQVGVLGGNQGEQLTDAAGLGQRFVAKVVVDIELLVFGPVILAEPTGQTLVERGNRVAVVPHLPGQFADILRAGILWKGKQLQTAHVHGLLPFFQPQEQLVHRTKRFHIFPLIIIFSLGTCCLPDG